MTIQLHADGLEELIERKKNELARLRAHLLSDAEYFRQRGGNLASTLTHERDAILTPFHDITVTASEVLIRVIRFEALRLELQIYERMQAEVQEIGDPGEEE